jgi:hypothetical protein
MLIYRWLEEANSTSSHTSLLSFLENCTLTTRTLPGSGIPGEQKPQPTVIGCGFIFPVEISVPDAIIKV